MGKKAILNEWAIQAIRHFGGSAHHLDVAKWIWKNKRDDLVNLGDLFYTWQYDLRWVGTELRRDGKIFPAASSPQGTWVMKE